MGTRIVGAEQGAVTTRRAFPPGLREWPTGAFNPRREELNPCLDKSSGAGALYSLTSGESARFSKGRFVPPAACGPLEKKSPPDFAGGRLRTAVLAAATASAERQPQHTSNTGQKGGRRLVLVLLAVLLLPVQLGFSDD